MQTGMIDSNQLVSAEVNISSAGTAVQASTAATSLKWGVLIKALVGNSGMIYVGNVSDDVTSANGIELDSGEQIFIACGDLSDLWFDTSSSGDDARLLYG
jgi:hypothetical protein